MENLILVHTGHHLPQYLKHCILQAKSLNIKVHLIISDSLRFFLNDIEIETHSESEYLSEDYLNYSLKCNIPNFRDNFLHRASSRFFLLKEYVKKNKIENFFHIENDILLYYPLSEICKILNKLKKEACVVMDSNNRGVSSLMWFKNEDSINDFCNLLKTNLDQDDMKNIASFFYKYPYVTNFPIFPKTKTNTIFKGELKFKPDNLFEELNYVFDGAAIGQYIGGIDPRNQSGFTKGFINETCIFDVSKAKYEFINRKPYIIVEDLKVPIFNLHIHSKNLKEFSNYE